MLLRAVSRTGYDLEGFRLGRFSRVRDLVWESFGFAGVRACMVRDFRGSSKGHLRTVNPSAFP